MKRGGSEDEPRGPVPWRGGEGVTEDDAVQQRGRDEVAGRHPEGGEAIGDTDETNHARGGSTGEGDSGEGEAEANQRRPVGEEDDRREAGGEAEGGPGDAPDPSDRPAVRLITSFNAG